MRAVIKTEYRAAPEGHTVVTYPIGMIVSEPVASWAIAAGSAEPVTDEVQRETKVVPVPEMKDDPPRRGRKRKG